MKRRYFLGLLVGGATAVAGGWALVLRRDDRSESIVLHLSRLFPERVPVCDLGRRAAEALPEKSTEDLLEALMSGPEWSDVSEHNAASILRDRIRRDHEEASTVDVDDWALSRTEAVFYALTWKLSCESGRVGVVGP